MDLLNNYVLFIYCTFHKNTAMKFRFYPQIQNTFTRIIKSHKNGEILTDKDGCYPSKKKMCINAVTGMIKREDGGRQKIGIPYTKSYQTRSFKKRFCCKQYYIK